ncbi:S-layer homology domain-containing protein, partial [Aedoeadaptatus coxii]|uniref:S-layer homology domain-containing protein n=1 Tax=Aedoeadaptatus coxii TaxID=755172 RepID=UPI002AD27374
KTFWVNPAKEVTIPVKNPVGKQYFTFKEWKMGADAKGDKYVPTTAKNFTEATTITATYEKAEDIIAYDPKDPKTKPEGYVRVTFEAEEGLTLSNDKAYLVKKDANITLGNAKLVKPDKTAKTGYEFKEWDKKDDLVLGTEDVVVKALATTLPATKEKKPGEQAPDGYVEVKFVAGDNGKLTENNADIAEKVYYVNPNKYVTITPPTAVGNTGYEFGAWNKDAKIPTQYKDPVTTITANFNKLKAVIPKINDQTKKPDGYVTVTFKLKDKNGSESKDGYISETTPSEFFVNPNIEVILTEPKVVPKIGYELKGWNPELNWRKYTKDTEIIGSFNRLDDIIPEKKEDGTPNAKPDGYITVTFDKGDHGKEITGQTVYYVNPKADPAKTIGEIKKPTVKAETGWKQKAGVDAWDLQDDMKILGPGYVIVKAKYDPIDDAVPKDNPQGGENTKPDGYIIVTFVKGDHGSLEGTTVYYVNPNKAVVLKDKAPTIKPDTGYKSAGWDTTIERAIQYKDGDKITALYNEPGTISKTEVAGYVKVEFKPGTNGELKGTTKYWIKPGVEVNIPAPTANPKVGYKFDKWDKSLTVTASAGDPTYEITAIYAEEDTIIPKTKADDSEKPNGYVTVNFITDGNGSLEGTTTYFVNPNKEADFTQTAENMTKKPKIGYTEKGGTWAPTDFKQTFKANAEFKFSFVKLENVIPAVEGEDRPEGYVTVTLIPTDKATDQTKANKSYWVKANTDISITSKPTGKTETLNEIEYTYTFKGWTVTRGTIASWDNETIAGKFIQDTEITAKYSTKVDYGEIVPAPVPKDNVITGKGNEPEAKDLIKNIPGSQTDPLPQGTKFKYTDDGKPDVTKPGKTKAKVEVKYPNGKTVVVEVPITVERNVVPQTGTDKPTVPDNYVKVEFVIDPAKGGKIADNETTIYYVNPNQDVTIPKPKTVAETGYSFNGWDKDTNTPGKYATATQVKGNFTKGIDIIPKEENGKTNTKPDGYVTVTFDKGANGSLEGQTVYFVNPDAGKILKDVQHPTIKPTTGFTASGWDKEDTTEIKTDITVTAQYLSKDDVVPKTRDDDSEKPEGYITVTFDTTDKGGNVKRVVYVNPNKPVVLKGYEPQGFKVKTGYSFAGWDTSINQAIQYQNGTIIKAVYNDPWKISTTEVQGYAKVEFNSGDHGKLIGVTDYWVKPGEDVYLPAPAVEPNVDYRFAGWDKSLTVNLKEGDPAYVITATYAKIEKPKEPERIVDTRVETRVIEVPVRDRNYRKEVWYMCGFGGDFRPHDGLKRSEAAQILANALREDGYKYDPNYPIAYKDVGKNWYAEAVRITTQANVFVGYPDGYFRPDDKISTVEWIATLRRFQQIAKEDGNHMNLRTGHWATGEIEAAYKAGWLGIYPQGLATFKADTPMPREEVAAVSNRAFNRVMDRDYIRRNDKNMTHYRDVNPSMWSYDDILLASNTFMHDGRFFKAHGITQDNVIFNVNIDGLTITQDLFQRVKR